VIIDSCNRIVHTADIVRPPRIVERRGCTCVRFLPIRAILSSSYAVSSSSSYLFIYFRQR